MVENIKTGDRVEIVVRFRDSTEKVFVSQVETTLNDNKVILHVPISYGKIVELPVNKAYNFLIFTESGLIKFEGVVEGYTAEGGFSFMQVKLKSGGEKIQRREFYRFSCVLPMKVSAIESDILKSAEAGEGKIPEIQEKKEMHQAIVKDIGGGGVRFISNAVFSEKDMIKCIVKMDTEYLIIIGQILQKYYFPKSNYKYQYRAVFTGILPSEQEKIIKFIFNEQKKILQRINY